MDEFDLGRLTDRDFEDVCRDLFGDILGVRFEVFPRGRDGGIDLRHVDAAGTTTIVQCKHWHRSGTPKLLSSLRKTEVPKVRRLKPDRYLLAVTVGLSPADKSQIVGDFTPYVAGPGDVFGVDDLVAALRDRPGIVERHFRLWLSSTTVLQTVLNRAARLRSSWLCEELPETIETFVPHDGFRRARAVLDRRRVCIIIGAPGVGKTTTAMMLAAWLMGHGYGLCEVGRDVDEVLDLWRDDEPQVFLFDDFLGRTLLEQPARNEDRRLVSLARRIRDTPGKALIMTSRDHILGDARRRSDQLSGREMNLATSAIELSDLDLGVRGHILYNYVDRSRIAAAEKARFANPSVWRPIVTHSRFNPRVVEETLRLADTDSADVDAELITNLNDPLHIWERIVDNELLTEAVDLLEVLYLSGRSTVGDLATAWNAYRGHMGRDTDGRLFRRAMRMLEGSMIRIDRQLVEFYNPSVEDYLRHHINAGRIEHLDALIAAVTDPDEAHRLVAAADDESLRRHLTEVEDMIFDVRDQQMVSGDATHLGWALSVAERLESTRLARHVVDSAGDLLEWDHGIEDLADLADLANGLVSSVMIPDKRAVVFRDRIGEEITDEVDRRIVAEDAFGAIEAFRMFERLNGYHEYAEVHQRLNALVAQRLDEVLEECAEGVANASLVAVIEELLWFLDDACEPGTAALADQVLQRSASAEPEFEAERPVPFRSDYEDVSALMNRLDAS